MERGRVETPRKDIAAFPATSEAVGQVVAPSVVTYTIDRSYQITTVNDAWDTFATANNAPHLISSAIVGTNLLQWIHGSLREEMHQVCHALFSGEIQRYDYHFDCSSPQKRRVCAMTMTPLRDADGSTCGIQFVSRNILEPPGSDVEQDGRVAGLADLLQRQQTALDRAGDQARALGDVLAALNEPLSVHATVKTLLSIVIQLMQVPAAAVYLRSGDRVQLIPYGSHGMDLVGSDPEAFKLATSLAGQVLAQGEPREILDTGAHPDMHLPRFADGGRPRSLYALPINTYEGSIGVLEVYARVPNALPMGERALLAALAVSAGIAITNARLFDEQMRARQEAELQAHKAAEQAARLRATLAGMTDGVWICNQSGVLVSVNDAGLGMFRLRRSDVVGQPLAALARLLEIQRGERRRLGLRLALQGKTTHSECDICPQGDAGSLTVDIRATPIRDDQGTVIGAVAVVRDITEAKATDRLKEEFLSVAAHELKTPITALKGYTQLALKRTPLIPQTDYIRRALETIDNQADRITKLVQKLLDVSRIQSGRLDLQMARFDLQELMTSVVEQAQLIAPSHTIDLAPHAPIMVTGDYERLEQVLLNLIDNAVKYSPGEGTIRLACEIIDDEVRVSVNDYGVGIPENKLPHIFDRWYQAHFGTHGDYGGMGLGLFICKEIVEQHGGHMWAASAATEGTTIGFVLPLPPGEPAPR